MSQEIYGFSAKAMQQLRELIRRESNSRSMAEKPIKRKHVHPGAATGVLFQYTDSYALPAYGVMEVWGEVTTSGVTYLKTRRPTATFRRRYLVNGSTAKVQDDTGLGYWLEDGGMALIDSSVSTGSITLDTEFGVKKDYFGLFPNRPGFQVFRYEVIDTSNVAYSVQREVTELIGKLGSGSISKGSTGAIDVYMGASGSEAATDFTDITCRALFAAVASGKWCVIENINGNWYVSQVECG